MQRESASCRSIDLEDMLRGSELAVRKVSNRILLTIAGRRFRSYSIIKHVGRRSGKEFSTPVSAFPLGDGFVVALLYGDGANVDWCRNVMAAGGCVLKTAGQEYRLERPEIIPASQALNAFPALTKRMLITRGIDQFLWVHKPSGGSGNVTDNA